MSQLVAVIGTAHPHARSYVQVLDSMPSVEVILADIEGHGDIPAPTTVSTLDEVWAVRDGHGPDAVVICTSNANHLEPALAAIERGIAVLCEKPLATTVDDAQRMVDAAAKRGVVLMTAYPVHFSPQIVALQRAIADGEFGDIVAVMGTNNGKIPLDRDWFTSPDEGGSLMDHVVHVAEILFQTFGLPKTVYATTGDIISVAGALNGETSALVTLTYPNGMVATIDSSWSQPQTASTWGGLTVHVAGTKGQGFADAFAERVEGPGLWLGYGVDTNRMLLETFLNAARTGTTVEPSGVTGLQTAKIVAAAKQSASTGQPVLL